MGQNRTVGPVTGAATAGGTIGAAIAQILVHFLPSLEGVEAAITVILTAGLSLLGGYLAPPRETGDIILDTDLDDTLDEEPAPGE